MQNDMIRVYVFSNLACAETTYGIELSSAPFPSEPAFMKIQNKKTRKGIEYFR